MHLAQTKEKKVGHQHVWCGPLNMKNKKKMSHQHADTQTPNVEKVGCRHV